MHENFDLLEQTIRLYNLKNVVAENFGLGDEEKVQQIKVYGSNSAVVLEKDESSVYQEIKVKTLDNYASESKLNIGLIKVDIEGEEQQFLAGAKETIKEQKPTLLVSIYHNPEDFYEIKPMIEEWNLGYTFSVYKPCDYSISCETLLIAEILDK